MPAPLIGITTYGVNGEGRYSLPQDYVTAVLRAGGVPVLIPPVPEQAAAYLERIDGLVLAGGGDLDPGYYGGARPASLYNLDRARDETELALARGAAQTGRPVLGICRGLQVLNVSLGGTLIEHLPDEVGENVLHRAYPREPTPHPVQLEAHSRLARILGSTELKPLSWHHQAIRRTAVALQPVGHAPDGTIEAVEGLHHPWMIAVQWHPELTAARDPQQQRLFDALVEATRTPSST